MVKDSATSGPVGNGVACYGAGNLMSEARTLKDDLMMLTKARLSLLVVVTTFFGFWLRSVGGSIDGWLMFHAILGTTLAALGSSVFNQLIEIDVDSKMERTKTRPLPAK